MVSLSLIPADFYLIDTSSIMAFSGADYTNPNRYLMYRDQIWIHLETMIDTDKLKTVREVWPELEFNDQASYARLQPRENKFILPKEHDIDIGVLNILSKYPKLIDYRQTFTREPADPFIIVYAKKWNVPIICDERPMAERIGARKHRRLKIPDVCQSEHMKDCICLEQYLKQQGIIPNEFH